MLIPTDTLNKGEAIWGVSGIGPVSETTATSGQTDPLAGDGLFVIYHPTPTSTATGGYTIEEVALENSPFTGHLQILSRDARRDEAAPGVGTIDTADRLWIDDVTALIQIGDIAILPQEAIAHSFEELPDGYILTRWGISRDDVRAKILRVRLNAGKLECALEIGAV